MLVDLLSQYGLFLAKTLTFVIAFLFVATALFALTQKSKKKADGDIQIQHLNDEQETLRCQLQEETLDKGSYKAWRKAHKIARKNQKAKLKSQHKAEPRLFVLRFTGDIRATAVTELRHLISAIIDVAKKEDEVLLILESGGGLVFSYGLAASQLDRLRHHRIHLTVAIDKVAASGGYMMAVVANTIYAAPFAVVGSIGVVAQMPNFHRLLEKHNIDFEQQTAGEYKRTLTLFGENTDKGREKFQEEIEQTHQLFKHYIENHRPQVDLKQVATGEHWHALDALKYSLIDDIKTSDEVIFEKMKTHQAYALSYETETPLVKKFLSSANILIEKFWDKLNYKPLER